MKTGKKLIVLSGGGSGGPVTPLLALVPDLRKAGYDVAWVGTADGIEKKMVMEKGIEYRAISAGKLRRYLSPQNFIDAFRVLAGFFQSLNYLSKTRPSLVMTAGGFVSVPLVWAAWALHVKVIVHQQDLRPGLANRLMAPFADVVTVTFEKSLKDFGKKAVWTGNPVQEEFYSVVRQKKEGERLRVLVLGGGTGAASLNKLVIESLPELTKLADVIHVTGGKLDESVAHEHYSEYEFLEPKRMAQEMADADLVVTRAGLGTLTELSCLGKPAILIPMPNSHQEDNAEYFTSRKAALAFPQQAAFENFSSMVNDILADKAKQALLGSAMKAAMKSGAEQAIIAEVKGLENS